MEWKKEKEREKNVEKTQGIHEKKKFNRRKKWTVTWSAFRLRLVSSQTEMIRNSGSWNRYRSFNSNPSEWMDIKIYRERKREKKLDLHKCILVLSESFGLVRSKSIVFTSYLSAVSHLGYRISISLCTGQDNKFYFSYFIFIFIRCVYCLWYATHTHISFGLLHRLTAILKTSKFRFMESRK